MLRRLAFALLLGFGLAHALANALAAPAQGAPRFPVRPITLIVPWPAGGATDISM
ncbi:tripartite tricarboxylate transporter substrate binding protein, partial [Cupriavidus basilensis]|nr:tripartite tricarboxylate transporter substrate binding protein [Cupriavidus basilensis]